MLVGKSVGYFCSLVLENLRNPPAVLSPVRRLAKEKESLQAVVAVCGWGTEAGWASWSARPFGDAARGRPDTGAP
jgi:hypothetical protein